MTCQTSGLLWIVAAHVGVEMFRSLMILMRVKRPQIAVVARIGNIALIVVDGRHSSRSHILNRVMISVSVLITFRVAYVIVLLR